MASENVEAANQETYFSHQERMFPELDGTDKRLIPTEQFLKACQGIAEFVGFLGLAFVPVKKDIVGNVHKVRTKFDTDRQRMEMLQDLVDIDLAENGGKIGAATEGLLWLKRGLEFMLELLKALVRDYKNARMKGEDLSKTENLSGILSDAYERTLKRHHNFVSKQIFKVVLHAAPYRRTLLLAIAYGHGGLEEISWNSRLGSNRNNPTVQSSIRSQPRKSREPKATNFL
uniref:Glycolipid transfer protein domain-containing protein n=1 Tax=Globodera rostochiensis TaxID=31243 RepID=A0A914IFN8_GLORO